MEKMHFQALQKRAKETKRQEKKTEVKQKDGTVKVIQKYKRKKRFGRSINRRAPARFLLELKRKAEAVGGVYAEVDTKEFKASQSDISRSEDVGDLSADTGSAGGICDGVQGQDGESSTAEF